MNISWMIPLVRKWPWQRSYNYNRVIASVWIRCLQLIPFLQTMNIQSQINKWDNSTDVAIFLRRWDNDTFKTALALKKKGVKIVLDTPVNYFSSQSHPQFEGPVMSQFWQFADIADCITCSSNYIAEYGKRLGFETVCLEDSINYEHFSFRRKKADSDSFKLIWSGVSVKANELNFLNSAIKENGWDIIIISDKKPELEFPYHFIKWDYKKIPQDIIKGDVAVFPRQVDNEYDKGHSFFKIGVFLAEHVPVVCSPVPSYQSVVKSSNGKFVKTLQRDDWCNAIVSVMNNNSVIDFSDNPIDDFSTLGIALKYKALWNELVG